MKHPYIKKMAAAGLLLSWTYGGLLAQENPNAPQEAPKNDAASAAAPAAPENPPPPTNKHSTTPEPPPAAGRGVTTGYGGGGGGMSGSMGGGGGGMISGSGGMDPFTTSFRSFDGDNRQGSMIILTKDPDSGVKTSAMSEDLAIMFRLLEKTMQSKVGDAGGPEAMNIRLYSFSGDRITCRNMYLQDYGALFFLKANMPLVRPPESKDNDTSKKDDAWEQAKKELNAPRFPGDVLQPRYSSPRTEFNENKVAALKTALIGNLKYASNIKWMKPDESIVVVIAGPPSDGVDLMFGNAGQTDVTTGVRTEMSPAMSRRYGLGVQQRLAGIISKPPAPNDDADEAKPSSNPPSADSEANDHSGDKEKTKDKAKEKGKTHAESGAPQFLLGGLRVPKQDSMSAGKSQSMLVVRAKKADVDSFASGKLSFDDFKGKVTVQAY